MPHTCTSKDIASEYAQESTTTCWPSRYRSPEFPISALVLYRQNHSPRLDF